MATPYGLAYGIGAGLSGIPQAAIQGLGMNQQMQQRDLQIADMQRQQAEERALSEAVQSGASRGLGYGDIAKEAAAKGAGGIAILKLQEMAQKQQAAKREQALQNITRAMAFGRKDIVLDEMNSIGLPIADFDVEPDGQNVTISPVPGKSVKMPLTDAAAWIMEGRGMAPLLRLQDMKEKAEADAAEKAKRRMLEEKKFTYKQETYDPELFALWRKRAVTAGAGNKPVAKLEIYRKFYDQAIASGRSAEEADKFAWDRAGGDVSERAMKTIEARSVQAQLNPLYKQLAELDPAKDKKEFDRVMGMIDPLQEQLRGITGRSQAAAARKPAQKPSGNIKWD